MAPNDTSQSHSRCESVQVRWMIRRDMPEMLATERKCFGDQAWPAEMFLHHLRQRNCIGMVAEVTETHQILGYSLYLVRKGALEIINLAVNPQHHRQGIGTAMMESLKSNLGLHRRRYQLSAWVGDANLGAHLFFRSQGFAAAQIDRGYYSDGQDAYEFLYDLDWSPV
jgi:[ribosomal protein S18]-alanine N-acetyltransferase